MKDSPVPSFFQASAFTIANRVIQVRAEDEDVARTWEHFIGRLLLSPCSQGTPGAGLTICCFRGTPPELPEGLNSFPIQDGVCYTDDLQYHLLTIHGRISYGGNETGRLDVWLPELGCEWPPSISTLSIMTLAVHTAMRRCFLYGLHSACVARPDNGEGVLFIGNSGSGKSSLSVRLASQNWQYLSDDVSLAFEQGPFIEVAGLRRWLSISPRSLSLALEGSEKGIGTPLPGADKVKIDPAILFPDNHIYSVIPRSLFFCVLSGESKTRIEELTDAQAMSLLLASCPWARFDRAVSRHFLAVLGKLVKQSRSFLLFAGKDIFYDRALASQLILAKVSS
jgi:hypothetical protein